MQMYWFTYLFNCLENYSLSLGFFVDPRDFLVQIPFMTLDSFKKICLNIYFNQKPSESEKCERLRGSHTLLKVQNHPADLWFQKWASNSGRTRVFLRVFHLGMKPRNAKEVELWNDSEVMPDLIPYFFPKAPSIWSFHLCVSSITSSIRISSVCMTLFPLYRY